MRKRALSILLCAVLTLSLAACGGGKADTGTQQSTQSTGGQQSSEKDTNSEPSSFLAALKKEYENGIAFGQTKDHTYVPAKYISADGHSSIGAVMDGTTLYVILYNDYGTYGTGLYAYDTKSKTAEFCADFPVDMIRATCLGYLDGWFYFWTNGMVTKVSPSGESVSSPVFSGSIVPVLFDGGVLCSDQNREQFAVLSLDMQIAATIPAPEQEAKHGIIEKALLQDNYYFSADGTVYGVSDTNLFKLDTKTNTWADQGALPAHYFNRYCQQLCGKYFSDQQKVYNILTGEEVFTYGVLYKSTMADSYQTLSYFGGDAYIGVTTTGGKNEYRWVNLKDNNMSDPLTFPEANTTIVDDTYCVYRDEYGVFLWNYSTGEEETIMMFQS